jgi:hypothetical protein
MTEKEAALLDKSFAAGMRLALAMAHQDAWEKARQVADRIGADALRVLRNPQ